jgi:hypothetical protein
MTTYADGVYQYGGAPVGGGRFSSPWATHRFVDAATGNDSNDGISVESAKATIQSAVTAAGRGDVIYIRPQAYVIGTGFTRYEEDVTNTLAQSDVSIIGVTNSRNPEYGVRWKHATATHLTSIAPAWHLENIGFFGESATSIVTLTNNSATDTARGSDGFTSYNCVFKGAPIAINDGGDGVTFDSCRFHCAYTGTVAAINYTCSANSGRRFAVRNCEWLDGNGTVSSGPMIAILPPMTEVIIRDCYFPQIPTGNAYITAPTGVEGLIANVHCAAADLAIGTAFPVSANLFTVGIYDELGLVIA